MAHDDPFFPFCKAKFAIWAVKGNFKAGYYHHKDVVGFSSRAGEIDGRGGLPLFESA